MAAKSPCLQMLSGKPIPQVGLGTWQGGVGDAIRIAVEAGYRHIDTARFYNNEGEIGEALEGLIRAGKVKRDEMYITTKLISGAAIPANVREQTDISLKLLRTQYIDLLLIHFPVIFQSENLKDNSPQWFTFDEQGMIKMTDIDPLETYKEMEKLVDAGLVKALGLSNFNIEQVQRIWDSARIKPTNLQCECHAWFPQNELVEFCNAKGMTFAAYAPMGSPGRPAIFKLPTDTDVLMEEPVIVDMATRLRRTPAQVLLKNLMQRGLVVIPKSTNKERIIANFKLFDFNLSDEDMKAIEGINKERRLFKFDAFKGLDKHRLFPFKL